MTAVDVMDPYNELQDLGINIWLDSGWGVDVLLGVQTREHSDSEIAIQQKDVPALVAFLQKRGYQRFAEMMNRTSSWVTPGSLTGAGTIGRHMVRCISAVDGEVSWRVYFVRKRF